MRRVFLWLACLVAIGGLLFVLTGSLRHQGESLEPRPNPGTHASDTFGASRDLQAPGQELPGAKDEVREWLSQVESPSQVPHVDTLAPAPAVALEVAQLEVLLVDAQGQPIVDQKLRVWVDPEEAQSGAAQQWEGVSDQQGTALLSGIPAEQRLVLGAGEITLSRVDAGGRLHGPASPHDALWLRPQEKRRVQVVLGGVIELRGRVFEPDGSPSPRAYVMMKNHDELENGAPRWIASTYCDGEGLFTLRAVSSYPVERLLLLVHGTVGEKISLSPFGGNTPPDPLHAAWSIIDWPGDGEPLEIRLRAMSKIHGWVRDEGGPVEGANIKVHSTQRFGLHGPLYSGVTDNKKSWRDGHFELLGLMPGAYDLEIEATGYATKWMVGVASGTRDLDVLLLAAKNSKVRLRMFGEPELQQVFWFCTRLDPLQTIDLQVPKLKQMTELREAGGWPSELSKRTRGEVTYLGPLGRAPFLVRSSWEHEHLLDLQPGLYWFGAWATMHDGTKTIESFGLGTGLVEVPPGEFVIDFHLRPAGEIHGQVLGMEPDNDWHVALAFPDGRLLPVPRRSEGLQMLTPVASDGSFVLRWAPVGPVEVRLGSREELLAGVARLRSYVEVEGGGIRQIRFDL